MIYTIFYKEWLKTKRFAIISLITILGISIYLAVNFNRLNTLAGANELWEYMLSGRDSMIGILEFIPLVIGIVLALSQYMPEMHNKCLKLTLHLPVSPLLSIFSMQLYGILVLLICSISSILAIEAGILPIFQHEIRYSILITAMPWYLGGIAAYLLTAWIVLEPTWKMRVPYILLSVIITYIFYLTTTPGAYEKFLPVLAICTPLLLLLAPLSITRFKEGKQD